MSPEVERVVHVLQAATAPAVLVSGVGLLLLTMTNRLARAIDRTRALAREQRAPGARSADVLRREALILLRRAAILRGAITAGASSVLLVALTIGLTFVAAELDVRVEGWILGCFGLALAALVVAMVLFITDLRLSLRALHVEVEHLVEEPPTPGPKT